MVRKRLAKSKGKATKGASSQKSSKLAGVTKSLLGLAKKVPWGHDADATKSVDARRGETSPLDARRLLKKACRRGRF